MSLHVSGNVVLEKEEPVAVSDAVHCWVNVTDS